MVDGPPEHDLLAAALAAVDEANAADPEAVVVDGVARPREVVHAERATHWLHVLDPDATPAQVIAARAHHLRRWELPRSSYPAGRAGYLRWRRDQKLRHAADVAELLRALGADPTLVERVATLVTKEGRLHDAQVQTHEDALCLVFLERQLDPVADQLGDEHTVEVLRRTAAKMSPAAVAVARSLPLSAHGRSLLEAALAPAGPAPD